ncbi:Geranylgeranyl diphosphate synthase sdnC [Beauveria bassiana]|nr:Geranylgeranyl diphosphate synthase sdnC [Beauveria bassiana]
MPSVGSYEQSNRPPAVPKSAASEKMGQNNSVFLSAFSPLDCEVIKGPARYIHSLPAKETRNAIIDALNTWLQLPDEPIYAIKKIITLLHEASLLLDDIQDGSILRRGLPATHTIYGKAQTINSAGYTIIEAVEEALKLGREYAQVVLEHLKVLYVGQSYDLHWRTNLECPSEEDYLRALDNKTGGLFHLLLDLMTVATTANGASVPSMHSLVFLLGRHFAIRDDYQNLLSDEAGF